MVISMKNNPIWDINKNNKYNDSLKTNNVDILIIGGGITGITTAYLLKNLNKRILLIDKDNLGFDTTYKSTAKISFIQKDIYQKLEKTYNYETSKLYFESQKEAINIITNIIKDEKIDCELEKVNSYLFTNKKESINKLNKERDLLKSFKVECFDQQKLPINYKIEASFYVENNYVFNPIKYIGNISKKLNSIDICINTMAFNIKKENNSYKVTTNNGIINTKKVIVTTHYPFFIFPNLIPIRNYISREYVNTCNYPHNNFTAINIDKDTESIRFYKDNIIYVSNNHRLTNKINYKVNYNDSKTKFKKNFNKEILYSWMNQDLMTNDYLPIIGYSRKDNKNLLLACGYNAWGMTNGVIAAKIISDLIMNKKNKYYNLFRPDRISLNGIINSIIDGIFYAKAYIEAPFIKKDNIYKVKVNDEDYFLYIDKNKNKHYVKTKCPHMKCNLVFNKEELTWDCPCHGSRFDIDGNIITSPTKNDIKKKNN